MYIGSWIHSLFAVHWLMDTQPVHRDIKSIFTAEFRLSLPMPDMTNGNTNSMK